MDELCPLCLKMGSNKRIKAVQINLDEVVWMCENEECPWPFGHEEPCFLLRKVGDRWSNDWEIYKKVQKRVGRIPISTELSLYTPPVTPSSDATSKDSTKSDFSSEAKFSEQINHIGSILSSNSIPNDSYAPKTSCYSDYTCGVDKGNAKASSMLSKNETHREMRDSGVINRTAPVLSSIFDIDGDEILSNKISVKETCSEEKETKISLTMLESLDMKNPPSTVSDTVLKTSEKQDNLSPQFSIVKKEETVSLLKDDSPTKVMPQIKSVARTNIDVQIMGTKRIVKNENIDIRSSGKTDERNSREKIAPDAESIVPAKQENLDDTGSSSQRTTTITIDGSFPITLTYDLTDFKEKPDETNFITTKSISDNIAKNDRKSIERNKNLDAITKISAELPKKQLRLPVKRRIASTGKLYEKFSFSSLKKIVRESKDCDDKSNNSIVTAHSNERVKLDDIASAKDEKSSVLMTRNDSSHSLTNNRIADLSSQISESQNSGNTDFVNTGITNDDAVVESFSDALDGILMEDYQNVTANLNDDWLDFFLT